MVNDALESTLTSVIKQLIEILQAVKDQGVEEKKTQLDLKVFFDEIRHDLFGGKLTANQVKGMEAKLNGFREHSFPLSWAAYAMATSYHETGRRMLPVREGFNASDNWRKRNLRYFPYYGRGDVQLTWKENYEKADRTLGLNGRLMNNLDLALDPDISAQILIRGMKEGWFSRGNSLPNLLPNDEATTEEFRKARPIVNIMDKAQEIALIATKFQQALKKAGYGEK